MLAFTRDEFARAFRRLGVPAAEAEAAASTVANTTVPDDAIDTVDADVLAALSLVSFDCERRVCAWIDALPPDRRGDLALRFARGRLHFGGRPLQ
jgi:hypothetical protein